MRLPPAAPRPGLRHALIPLALAAVVVLLPDVARAAPPPNDNFANATVINLGALPYSNSVPITEATTEGGEPFFCAFSTQTVWYRLTPTSDGWFSANGSGVRNQCIETAAGCSRCRSSPALTSMARRCSWATPARRTCSNRSHSAAATSAASPPTCSRCRPRYLKSRSPSSRAIPRGSIWSSSSTSPPTRDSSRSPAITGTSATAAPRTRPAAPRTGSRRTATMWSRSRRPRPTAAAGPVRARSTCRRTMWPWTGSRFRNRRAWARRSRSPWVSRTPLPGAVQVQLEKACR